MSAILVTGGAGFIGSCFVRDWLTHSAAAGPVQVINLDKLTYAGNLDSLSGVLDDPRHLFVEGDIGDSDLVGRLLLEHQPAGIVNFAAESHVDRSIDSPAAFLQTNVLGVQRLLDATLAWWRTLPAERQRAFRILHVSTDEVYGSLGAEGRFTEESQYAPNSPYAASKAASDHLVRAWHHTYGLPTLLTNCSNNYGPRQFPEKLVPLVTLNCLEGKPLPVYGDGRQVRDWLFVADHCEALRLVLNRGAVGEVYNIGGNCEKPNIDVVHAICDTVDRLRPGLPHAPCRNLITFVTDRPGHDRRYAIDAAKIQRALGWSPRTDFTTGLETTIRWYLDHPAWIQRIHSGVYQRQRLGLGSAEPT